MLFNNTIDISEVFSGQGTWMAKERDSKVRSFEGRSFKGIMARRAINKLILIVILLIITWINVSQIISFDRVAECVQVQKGQHTLKYWYLSHMRKIPL